MEYTDEYVKIFDVEWLNPRINMKSLQVLSARDAALLIMRVIIIGGALASLKMMMKKYHFRKGVRSGLLVRITNWTSYWLFSVRSSNGMACANL